MRAEHRADDKSIPAGGMSVKNMIVQVMAGRAVRVHDTGMDVSGGATETEVLAAIADVRDVADLTKFFTAFCQGDAYSQSHRRADIGEKFPAAFKKRFGVKVYNEVRQFAWVAEKWPKSQRDSSKSWSWHRDNDPPGRKPLKRPKPPVTLSEVRTEIVDGAEWVYQVDDYGKPYVLKRKVK